ncbi:MAG: 16S rRNA (cytosine(967)-C(5))-methyltransferase RsmB [Gammaproteobacteria bacterium]|nr:16S rRNA (cytosine(967)-C(5))-methyltransferase RsmB [Gammaproteobacteria bacterium]
MENTSPAKKKKSKQAKGSKAKVSVARQASLKTLRQVFGGQSLSAVQQQTIDNLEDSRDRGLANEVINGVLRWRWQLEFLVSKLLSKPLKQKDIDIQLILLMALYELIECRTPDYAIINEAVELVRKSGKKWAASLVNAVLRRFTREKEKLLSSIDEEQAKYSHPDWMLKKIKDDWPDDWQEILQANNQRPAFWLRVNQTQSTTTQYQTLLTEQGIDSDASSIAGHALKLVHGVDVRTLPGFNEGALSVQDVGAQLTAQLLDISDGHRVLDLCAAPGGKTCHLLERYQAIEHLVAVELDEKRMQRVSENLQRLKFLDAAGQGSKVELIVADARKYKDWWDGNAFDRILIDAPCSASGVIRRHPDIKTLRRESDINQLVELQSEILSSAWQILKPGGELLYVTCSVFKDENQNQIADFIEHNAVIQKDAVEIKINTDWGKVCDYGRQLLPGEQDADGFYFCKLKKLSVR